MNDARKIFIYLILIWGMYLLYLCGLDMYFVFVKNQVEGWYNYGNCFIATMPIAFVLVSRKCLLGKYKFLSMLIIFLIGILVSYFSLLWVLMDFHLSIGGSI